MEAIDDISLDPQEEQTLIQRAQSGDEESFERLVKAHMRRVYYVALGLTRNHDDALDCSQEAFVKAYRHLKRFHLGSPFFPWLYRIARNHCLNHLQKARRRRGPSLEQLDEDYGIEFTDDTIGPRDSAIRNERDAGLRRAIDTLKPDFREIILLKHFHEMSYKEMAETLDIPMGTVMSRLFNARSALRAALEQEGMRDSPANDAESVG